MKKNKKILYSWVDFLGDIDSLEREIKQYDFRIKNVYGVPRGGLIIAVILSHRLKVPLILSANRISDQTLIVDDISDTGKTLKKIAKKTSLTATLWVTPHTKFTPFFYRNVLNKDEWVVFPFETLESSKRDGTI